ncbi:MAG TPA: hypothetical protein VGM28_02890 [Candidatus Limnocylindrales bacterium]|jgi:hypothetical protein
MTARPTFADAIAVHYEKLAELTGAAPEAVPPADPRGLDPAAVAEAWDAFYVDALPHLAGCIVPSLARPELERHPGRDGTRVVRCPECRAALTIDAAGRPVPTARRAGGPPRGAGSLTIETIRSALAAWPRDGHPTQAQIADAAGGYTARRLRQVIADVPSTWETELEEALAPR